MDRRRQNRISVSCNECRTRKLRCDRARPCTRCVQAGRETLCSYDSSSRPIDGQLAFTVDRLPSQPPPQRHQHAPHTADRGSQARMQMRLAAVGPRASTPPAPQTSSQLELRQRQPSPEPQGEATQLQMLWHGSRSVDSYIEPLAGRTISTPKEVMFGENDATVYWGRSHETNFVPRITDVVRFLLQPEAAGDATAIDSADNSDSGEVSTLLHVERNTRPGETVPVRAHDPELRALLPPQPDVDILVERYMQIFEAQYKIIHVPTFRREYARYWSAHPVESEYGPPTFLAQLLSICAIGSAFVTTAAAAASYAATRAGQWIEAVRLWLFKQDPRLQMTLGHLQAHLLMLVAGDVHWIKIDRSWISSGMLVRNAISAGLHREPRAFTRVAPFFAEMRRRLWYAILEFDLQASFAKGRTPAVREDEYDCEPPLPISDDALLSEDMTEDAIGLAPAGGTRSSPPPLYVCLAKTMAVRSEVCRAVNGIRLVRDYGQVLRLDARLQEFVAMADAATRTLAVDDTRRGKAVFLRILTRRARIALHAPFLPRALHDARYLYSRNVCVETATLVLTEALSLLDCGTPESALFFAFINNICRCDIANSVFLLCHDMLAQAVKRQRLHHSSRVAVAAADTSARADSNSNSAPGWQQDQEQQLEQHKLRLASVVGLMERTAQATSAICKPDIVSQRTCAWMQLSAELSRAAVGDDTMTAAVMKASIGRSIQAYQASLHQHPGPIDTTGLNEVDASFFPRLNGSETLLDDDYINLFFDLNNIDMTMTSQWL